MPSSWVTLAIALPSAAMMGLAIQRGATCMVAAVAEVVISRQAGRARALGEASLWVGGGLALASLAGLLRMAPVGYAIGPAVLLGGALLGLGALVNGACVFGAVARLGSGQWAYAATPLGFFLGCLAVDRLAPPIAHGAASPSAALTFALPVALVFLALLCWRLAQATRAPNVRHHMWHPHRATLVIGVTFVTTMLSVGAWSYTEALSELASMMGGRLPLRLAMFTALLAGAIAGGWIAGLLKPEWPRPMTVLRCIAGGALMGVGSLLVPGSNDGLIMIGLPLLLPHAWAAVAVMALAIAIPLLIARGHA